MQFSKDFILHPGQKVPHGQGFGVHAAGQVIVNFFRVIDPAAAVGLLKRLLKEVRAGRLQF